MKNEDGNSRQAFTLAEVMVAVVIMTLLFGGVFAMGFQSRNIMRSAREESRAIQAAQYELERLRTYLWGEVTALGSTYSIPVAGNSALSDLSGSSGVITITPFPASDINPTLVTVCIAISYESYDGTMKTNVIVSRIAEQGLLK